MLAWLRARQGPNGKAAQYTTFCAAPGFFFHAKVLDKTFFLSLPKQFCAPFFFLEFFFTDLLTERELAAAHPAAEVAQRLAHHH
jgi:hypothetical protein